MLYRTRVADLAKQPGSIYVAAEHTCTSIPEHSGECSDIRNSSEDVRPVFWEVFPLYIAQLIMNVHYVMYNFVTEIRFHSNVGKLSLSFSIE